jgi:hypothetical protein
MTAVAMLLQIMDKEPTLLKIWILFLSCGAIGFVLCRLEHRAVIIIFPAMALFSYFWYSKLNSPNVASAIRAEAGHSYVYQSYLAIIMALVAPILGAILKLKSSKSALS